MHLLLGSISCSGSGNAGAHPFLCSRRKVEKIQRREGGKKQVSLGLDHSMCNLAHAFLCRKQRLKKEVCDIGKIFFKFNIVPSTLFVN